MDAKLILALCIGTLLMLGVLLICRRWYQYPFWKTFAVAPMLTLTGLAGVKILFFIENGKLDGLSFFGSVFLIPIIFILVSKILKWKYSELMDNCAPAICIMLALMKVMCFVTGCCKGKILFTNVHGNNVRFPSQIVELICALLILVVLMLLMRNVKNHGKIYPWFMIIYGSSRFVLNLFRQTIPFIWNLPIGNIWSVVSTIIGIVWLLILQKKSKSIPTV